MDDCRRAFRDAPGASPRLMRVFFAQLISLRIAGHRTLLAIAGQVIE
jgi:hypothetical protein